MAIQAASTMTTRRSTRAFLGNPSSSLDLPRGMNVRSQPCVTHQVLGGRKARDLTDGRQDGHSRGHTHTRQLKEEGQVFVPPLARAQVPSCASTSRIRGSRESSKARSCPSRKCSEAESSNESHHIRATFGECLPHRGSEIVSLQHAMETIARLGPLLNQPLAVRD
jgi:hypothetical protein